MNDKADKAEQRLTAAYGTTTSMPTTTRDAFHWLAYFAPTAILDGLAEGFERLNVELAERDPTPDTDAIVAAVRETLERLGGGDLAEVTGVVFTSTEYDDGYFLDETGEVFFTDGTAEYQEFPVHDELTEGYGVIGGKAALGVRLSDGATEYDDYASTVYHWLGVDKKWRS